MIDSSDRIELFRCRQHFQRTGHDYIVDRPALIAIVERFQADQKLPVIFRPVPSRAEEADSAGLLDGLACEGESLVGHVTWNEAGNLAVRSGRYCWLSLLFDSAHQEDVEGGRIRPLRLDSLILTNQQNF